MPVYSGTFLQNMQTVQAQNACKLYQNMCSIHVYASSQQPLKHTVYKFTIFSTIKASEYKLRENMPKKMRHTSDHTALLTHHNGHLL